MDLSDPSNIHIRKNKDRKEIARLELGLQQTDFDTNSIVWDALKEDIKNTVNT